MPDSMTDKQRPENPVEFQKFAPFGKTLEIQGDHLEALYAPGLYELTCTVTKKSYFGESTCVLERMGRHYRQLQGGTRMRETPELQTDWNHHGPKAFLFRILLSGPEWASKVKRRRQELRYITTNSTRVYNKYPTASSTHRVQCCIDGVSYISIAEAARAVGVSESEVRRRLDNPLATNYVLGEKMPNGKPFELDGIWYATRQEAAKRLNCSRTTILRRIRKIKDTNTPKSASNDYPD